MELVGAWVEVIQLAHGVRRVPEGTVVLSRTKQHTSTVPKDDEICGYVMAVSDNCYTLLVPSYSTTSTQSMVPAVTPTQSMVPVEREESYMTLRLLKTSTSLVLYLPGNSLTHTPVHTPSKSMPSTPISTYSSGMDTSNDKACILYATNQVPYSSYPSTKST